jgi:hypothetical protein
MHPAGDVNDDGFDDVLVGAAMWDGEDVDCGQVRLYLGGADGVQTEPQWVVDGAHDNANLGICVAGAGDVNGDGFDDVVIGERRYSDEDLPERGRALLYLGGSTGPGADPTWQARGPGAFAHFGLAVAGIGDVDLDGFDDIAVGGDRYSSPGLAQAGMVEVYRGGPAGCTQAVAWRALGEATSAHLGHGLWPGDFDGDGSADLLMSAPLWGDASPERGLLIAFRGPGRK